MIKIFPTVEELNEYAAGKFVEIAKDSIANHGKFSVALSGGSTPKALHGLLAGDKFKSKIDWQNIFFFFGDERNVAPNDEESNFRMANETLFEPLNIREDKIFRWQTELKDAKAIVENYRLKLRNFFELTEHNFPRFDLIMLGMGDDGHTASLFPNTQALKETEQTAALNHVEKLDTTRLTLTFPVINNARNVVFLIKGAEKAEALKNVLEGDFQPGNFPAQAVKLKNGNLFWLVDNQAARLLDGITD
jgi:6-phosphogluconolactonase